MNACATRRAGHSVGAPACIPGEPGCDPATRTLFNSGAPGSTTSPFYFGGGGVPPVFASLDLPRIAFRFKPMHQMQIRIEAAYNLYGFSFGGSLGYGF